MLVLVYIYKLYTLINQLLTHQFYQSFCIILDKLLQKVIHFKRIFINYLNSDLNISTYVNKIDQNIFIYDNFKRFKTKLILTFIDLPENSNSLLPVVQLLSFVKLLLLEFFLVPVSSQQVSQLLVFVQLADRVRKADTHNSTFYF